MREADARLNSLRPRNPSNVLIQSFRSMHFINTFQIKPYDEAQGSSKKAEG